MFRPAALFIGLRYIKAKRQNHFISFITLISMLGIALGVAVLITVLSVMNGFDSEIKKRVFSMAPPITVSSVTGYVASWNVVQKKIANAPGVTASAPFVSGEVLLSYAGIVQPAMVNGILPEEEKKVSEIGDKIVEGNLADLQPGEFGIALGESLANHLEISLGDKVTVITPKVSLSPAGVIPRFKRFTVVSIFRAGNGFGFDAGLAFINLHDAQKLFSINDNVTGLHVGIQDVYTAPKISQELMTMLSSRASITNWTDTFGAFFRAIQLEKTMMFLILLMIIAVAAFNLVATLVMVVSEKESDIAILRTFGATPRMIMLIFIIQGGVIGILGTLLGVLGGIVLALNATDIVNWIQHIFHVQFLSSSVYFVDYLPSKIEYSDIIQISLASLFLSLFATIYPAWRAAKMDPVESLRYE